LLAVAISVVSTSAEPPVSALSAKDVTAALTKTKRLTVLKIIQQLPPEISQPALDPSRRYSAFELFLKVLRLEDFLEARSLYLKAFGEVHQHASLAQVCRRREHRSVAIPTRLSDGQ
jgi:hypothetical protein